METIIKGGGGVMHYKLPQNFRIVTSFLSIKFSVSVIQLYISVNSVQNLKFKE